MIAEHIFYNGAIAVIAGMIYHRLVSNDPHPYAWIIVVSAASPDFVPRLIRDLSYLGIPLSPLMTLFNQMGGYSGAILLGYMVFVGLLFLVLRFRFIPSAIFAGLGYFAHLAGDSFIYSSRYLPFWSSLSRVLGLGSFRYFPPDFFGIASTPVLILGIGLFLAAVGIRVAIDGTEWIRHPLGMHPVESNEYETEQ